MIIQKCKKTSGKNRITHSLLLCEEKYLGEKCKANTTFAEQKIVATLEF